MKEFLLNNTFSKLLNLNRISLVLLVLPYIVFNWYYLQYSPYSNITNSILLFIILITTELIFKILILNKPFVFATKLLVSFLIIFFYGFYFVNFIQDFILKQSGIIIRGRFLLIFLSIFISGLIFSKRIVSYYSLNIFFLINSSLIIISNNYVNHTDNKIESLESNYVKITNIEKNKPLILIILDEYQSPNDLFNIFKDSTVFEFSENLKRNKWNVRNSSFTYEISTIHSLSSLFNFNLSKNGKYSTAFVIDIGLEKLTKAAISDSLKKKNVFISNYGILDIGRSSALTKLYFYPKNFRELFLMNTILYHLGDNTGSFNFNEFKNNYYPTETHNKFLLNNLIDSINNIKQKNFFSYVHLYMPHAPLTYEPEFRKINNQNISSYYKFWNFTNYKITQLLNKLNKDNKFKIILTGDHGFRRDSRLNPHYTFTAFYGFEEKSLVNIKSIQDLGSLIYQSY